MTSPVAQLPYRSGRTEAGPRRSHPSELSESRVPADRPALDDPGRVGWVEVQQLHWLGSADPLLPSDYFLG
jgi:hypothetical protein